MRAIARAIKNANSSLSGSGVRDGCSRMIISNNAKQWCSTGGGMRMVPLNVLPPERPIQLLSESMRRARGEVKIYFSRARASAFTEN